jgi:hypothetical protein
VPAISESIRRLPVDPSRRIIISCCRVPSTLAQAFVELRFRSSTRTADQHGTSNSNHQPSNAPDKLAPAESPEPITQQMTDELLTKGRFTHPAMHVSCCCCSRCTCIRSVCWPVRHAPIRSYHHRHAHTPTNPFIFYLRSLQGDCDRQGRWMCPPHYCWA